VRRRRMLARVALREILAHYLEAAAADLSFSYGKYGKPCMDVRHGGDRLQFNLSRTGDYCLVAVSKAEVGIDVETVKTREDVDALASRFFAPSEAARLARLHGARKVAAFYSCWTCKEAVVKALGGGLASGDFERFSISFAGATPLVGSDGSYAGAHFRLATPSVPRPFVAAIARRGPRDSGPLVRQPALHGGLTRETHAAIQYLHGLS
jgi:4'-phosphopantetheinyl transferase